VPSISGTNGEMDGHPLCGGPRAAGRFFLIAEKILKKREKKEEIAGLRGISK